MGRRPTIALVMAVMAMSAAACDPAPSGLSSPSPSPVQRAVADEPPYVCNFVPQAEVAGLTGYSGVFKAGANTRHPVGNTCVVSNDTQSIIITSYQTSVGRQAIDNYLRNGEQEGRAPLPTTLGKGEMSSDEIRGFPFRRVGVWFRCGAAKPIITIQLKKNPGRDQDHDLVQLVTIAERRYGEMFGCTPAPDPR